MSEIRDAKSPQRPRSASPEQGTSQRNSSVSAGPHSRGNDPSRAQKKLPHLGVFGEYGPAPSLENAGSVARDHLANERTWLAYVRTSLAIASAGVALVQLFAITVNKNSQNPTANSLRRFVRPLGGTAVAIATLVLLHGFLRYFKIQTALIDGQFPPARKSIGYLSAALVILVAITFGFLVGASDS